MLTALVHESLTLSMYLKVNSYTMWFVFDAICYFCLNSSFFLDLNMQMPNVTIHTTAVDAVPLAEDYIIV